MKDIQVTVALKEPRKAMGSAEKVWTIKSFRNLQCPLGGQEYGVWLRMSGEKKKVMRKEPRLWS